MLYFSFGNKAFSPVFPACLSGHVLGTVFHHSSEILTCLKNTVDGFPRNSNTGLKTIFDLKQQFLFSFCPLSCTKYMQYAAAVSLSLSLSLSLTVCVAFGDWKNNFNLLMVGEKTA
jgi:hypothetical protein